MNEITYKNVDELLVAAVPELAETLTAALQRWRGEHPGQYTVFAVFDPLVDRWIDSNTTEDLLRRLFGYYERMALSKDSQVVNLLWLAVLEHLLGSPDRFAKAWSYMQPATRKCARRLARMRDRDNLVPGRLRTLFDWFGSRR
jgi:hypothetical protein